MSHRSLGIALVGVLGTLAACADPGVQDVPTERPPAFVEVARAVGLDFVHRNGATGEFYYPELMHSGAALLDYDGDGHLDVFFPQAGWTDAADAMFHNRGDGTFEDATSSLGGANPGYGTGVAAADYDADGDIDIYVTNLGPNVLYRNEGSATTATTTFTDVTDPAAVGGDGYSASAAFLDYDTDGDLDLYVVNYIAWTPEIERPCVGLAGLRGYCGPDVYNRPQADRLYRNEGDGTFRDVSDSSGIGSATATGLGIATADFNDDGHIDIYVANDGMANLMWINQGDGTFRDEALARGVSLNGLGEAEAGMGVAAGDADNDGDLDIFVTHLSGETNTFYRNLGDGSFYDVTDEVGLGTVSRPYTGFGTGLFDYDCDGWLDLFIANGKVRMGDRLVADYAESNQLLQGGPGGFRDVSRGVGDALEFPEVSRGAAFGDVDNDGDIDVLLVNNSGPARLLRNEACTGRHWLSVALIGNGGAGPAVGASVALEVGSARQRRTLQSAHSYSSSGDPRLHFGLGAATTVDRLTVTWPDGQRDERADVRADQFLVIQQPK